MAQRVGSHNLKRHLANELGYQPASTMVMTGSNTGQLVAIVGLGIALLAMQEKFDSASAAIIAHAAVELPILWPVVRASSP